MKQNTKTSLVLAIFFALGLFAYFEIAYINKLANNLLNSQNGNPSISLPQNQFPESGSQLTPIVNDPLVNDFPFKNLSSYDSSQSWRKYTVNSEDNSGQSITFRLPDEVSAEPYNALFPLSPFPSVLFDVNNSTMIFNELEFFSTSGTLFLVNAQKIGQININFLGTKLEIPILQNVINDNSSSQELNKTTRFVSRFFINPFDLFDKGAKYQSDRYPVSLSTASLDDFYLFLKIIESAEASP